MVNHVNWLQLNQPIKGDFVQGHGNPASNTETPATGVASGLAPTGSNYAMVWATVDATVAVDTIYDSQKQAVTNGFTVALPANQTFEVFNIVPGTTTITMTDI